MCELHLYRIPTVLILLNIFELNALDTPNLTFEENVNLCDNVQSVLIGGDGS